MRITNGVLISINKKKDIKKGNFTVPDSVKHIGNSAFEYCSKLTSVTIGNNVMSIGGHAFCRCINLTNVTIGASVMFIGCGAFSDCSSLLSIEIPDSVINIDDWAFWGCSNLKSITIGSGVTRIGDDAFHDCESLIDITIPDSVTSIGYEAFSGCDAFKRPSLSGSNIKAVKGFYKFGGKMYCKNNFVYEIGKTYEEPEAKLCEMGFHACTLGLDVFNYYAGENNKVYCEVELSGVTDERRDDSKICGTKITILRELTVAEAANYVSKGEI